MLWQQYTKQIFKTEGISIEHLKGLEAITIFPRKKMI